MSLTKFFKAVCHKLKYWWDYLRGKTEEQLFEKKLKSLLSDVDKRFYDTYEIVLRNQYKASKFRKNDLSEEFQMKIAKKVLDSLKCKEFVGIQPLNGPVGLNYFLFSNTKENNNVEETNVIEKTTVVEIVDSVVKATSVELEATLEPSIMEDLNDMHELDVESEVIKMLSHEVALNYDNLVIKKLIDMSAYSLSSTLRIDRGTSPKEFSNIIADQIHNDAIGIANATRRGKGNFVIASSKNIPSILEYVDYPYKWIPNDKESFDERISYAGTLKGKGGLDVDVYFFKEKPMFMEENQMLIGYKGGRGEVDCGLVFSPYTVLNPLPMADSTVKFLGRYGINELQDNGLKIGVNYYRLTSVEGL